MVKQYEGVAFFLFDEKRCAEAGLEVLQSEGIESTLREVPDYLYAGSEMCICTSLDDSFDADTILECNKITINNIHKEVGPWHS